MTNPFSTYATGLNGPATDLMPVTPDDGNDLGQIPVALYVAGGGVLRIQTVDGSDVTLPVADHVTLPVGVRRVYATDTTATDIFGYIVK